MYSRLRQLRKYWKRYTFGTAAFTLLASYLTRKLRDNNVIREYCHQAKIYGEGKTLGLLEQQKKVIVFLNPNANKQEAKIQFTKYCAPLFHLAGIDTTVVESDYDGQIRTLMGYIDPNTDVVIVAGGDGTLMEVVNGLMRRCDSKTAHTIPIGVLPLGKENRFYRSSPLASHYHKSPARRLGEATLDIISGATVPVDVMALQPENGKTLYAMSSVQWGAPNDATENRDSFKLFGKLCVMASHVSTALRRWPTDHHVHIWMPVEGWSTESTSHGGKPPSERIVHHDKSESSGARTSNHGDGGHVTKTANPVLNGIAPLRYYHHASCAQHNDSTSTAVDKLTSLANNIQGHSQWSHRTYDVIGFGLSLSSKQPCTAQPLLLSLWSNNITKGSFMKYGWSETVHSSYQLPCQTFQSSEMIIQPVGRSWLRVDGEEFEPMPLAIRVLPDHLQVLARSQRSSENNNTKQT